MLNDFLKMSPNETFEQRYRRWCKNMAERLCCRRSRWKTPSKVDYLGLWPWNTSFLLLDNISNGSVEEVLETIPPKKGVHKNRVCLRTSWTNNTVRWISGGEDVLSLLSFGWTKLKPFRNILWQTSAVFSCRWATQLNDTSCLAPFFSSWRSFCLQSRRTLLRYHWE